MHHHERHFGRCHSSGQTLIEAAIATAVLAVLAGLGLPALGDALARQSIASAASSWRDAHAIGRSHAILRRTPAVLCPSEDGESCRPGTSWEDGFMLFEDPNRNRMRDPGERVVRVFSGHSRTRMMTSAGRRVIVFHPTGRTDGSNVTMTICDPRRAGVDGRRLVTSNSGRTRSEVFNCAR